MSPESADFGTPYARSGGDERTSCSRQNGYSATGGATLALRKMPCLSSRQSTRRNTWNTRPMRRMALLRLGKGGRRTQITSCLAMASICLVGQLVLLDGSDAALPTANSLRTSGSRVALSVDGRAHEIDVAGRLLGVEHLIRKEQWRVILQQRTTRLSVVRWRKRASGPLSQHGGAYVYRLRWKHPPPGRQLRVRVIVTRRGQVIARSAARQVLSRDPGTVFYSGECNAGAGEATGATWRLTAGGGGFCAFENHYDGLWMKGNCDTSLAAAFPSTIHSQKITQLAGYSLGRLGPIYFLKQAPTRASEIDYILLLDPANTSNLSKSCDANPSIGAWNLLASWLAQNSGNRLVIMAGPLTSSEEHAAIRAYYLRNLSAATLAAQVFVCDTSTSHDDFMKAYGWMVGAAPPSSCPTGSKPYHVPKAASPTPATPGPSSSPASLPAGQFRTTNASGGVYWRSAPDWNTPVASAGNGFYNGTVIGVSCYQAGAANVPGTADAMWEQASWVSGPGSGSGWINEHFIEDGAAINQPSPGAPACSSPSPPAPPPPTTWAEQETPNHPVNTFTNYHNASGMGPAIAAGQWVNVSCKVYDPTIQSVNPDGYWYRIASSPWNNAYYSPANTFMNGDPYGGPYTHNTDFAVPNC